MPTFSTTFTPPDPLVLELVADLEASAMRLSWGQTSLAQVDFGGYRVYRSLDGTNFTLLRTLLLIDEVSYDDFLAPLNVNATYRVTQSNLDSESDPAEASATLETGAWWVVEPSDASLTFPITGIRAARLVSPKVQDVYSPIGRPGKMVVGDVVQAEDGEVSFQVMPDNLGAVALWKAAQARMEGDFLVKATDGSLWRAQFGDLTRAFTNWGGQELTIPLIGTG